MKKLFYLFLLFSSIVSAGCANAKEESYVLPFEAKGDLPNFGLRGPVKSVTFDEHTYCSLGNCVFSTKGILSSDDVEDAEFMSRILERNEDGNIIGINVSGNFVDNVKYYSDGHVMSYSQWVRYVGNIIHNLYYDNNGYLIKEIIINEEEGDSTKVTFTYPEIDENGNWLKRVCENDTISREIEYYSEDDLNTVADKQDSIETVIMPTAQQVLKIINDSWQQKLSNDHSVLKALGMTLLEYNEEQEEEYTPCLTNYYICYGKNAKVETYKNSEGYDSYRLYATDSHAVVIEISIDTENEENIYFSDKEDFLNFKKTLPNIKDKCDVSVESDDPENGWYRVHLHM